VIRELDQPSGNTTDIITLEDRKNLYPITTTFDNFSNFGAEVLKARWGVRWSIDRTNTPDLSAVELDSSLDGHGF